MAQIASKNLYELLGNDPELDPSREPEPPTKAIDKPVQRAGKRNAASEAPVNGDHSAAAATGGRGGRQANFVRGEQAGTGNNRAEQRDDGLRPDRHAKRDRDPRDRGAERGRGPRGERRGRGRGRGDFGGARDDRHSHTGLGEHEKQAAHGWGAENANAELDDEKAGDAIADAETKNEPFTEADAKDPAFSSGPALAAEDGEAEAEEDKTKSYDQYLADLAEKRMALSGGLDIRKPNEGSKQSFPEGKAHARENESYFAGAAGKARREKENKQKNLLTVDGQYYAPLESGDRGGRGRGRGGRGRGEGRGDRVEGRGRGGGGRGGRGEGRDSYRGDRGNRGDRTDAPRGRGGNFNANDQSAFPALGGN